MRRLFGKKKEPALPEGPSLGESSDNLERRIQVLKGKIEECDGELRKLRELVRTARGMTQNMHKQKMMQIMKRRKMYAGQLEQLSSTQFNLDQVAFNAENIQSTIDSFNALKRANEVQKQQMKKLNIDHLEDVMDDMNDMQMDMEEMNEIMSRSYAIDDINEDDLEAELAELDQEMLEENMRSSSMKTPVYLPGQAHDEPLIEHS
jgi:charged multivesicular body protein 5